MPITDTLEPKDPEQLQTKIFATTEGEDDVILLAVQEHLDKWGYNLSVVQTKGKPKDVPFSAEKVIVYLIMGHFLLEDGTKVKEVGKASVVEMEDGIRVGGNSAVVIIIVD